MSREWNSSGVMQAFLKIAAESGLITSDLEQKEEVGNPSEKDPKYPTRSEETEDYKLEVEGGNLVEKAHPDQAWMAEKSTPVNSMGEGSLVENVEEQQKKDIEVATRMPSGALFGIHASVLSELVKLANTLDDDGKHKESTRIDQTIERLGRFPFVDSHLRKEAGWFLPIIFLVSSIAPYAWNHYFNKGSITKTKGKPDVGKGRVTTKSKPPMGRGGKAATTIGLGLAALAIFGKKLTSLQEGIKKDTQDLYEILQKAAPESAAAASAAAKLAPHVKELGKRPENAADYERYRQKVSSLVSILPSIQKDIQNVLAVDVEAGPWTWTGLDLHSRISEKLSTWENSLDAMKVKGKNVDMRAKQESYSATSKAPKTPGSGIPGLQEVLMAAGLLSKASGTIDADTLVATNRLEKRLDADLKTLYERKTITKKPLSFDGKILKGGKLSMDPVKLGRIVNLVKRLKTVRKK